MSEAKDRKVCAGRFLMSTRKRICGIEVERGGLRLRRRERHTVEF